LVHVIEATSSLLAQFLEIGQNADCLLHSHLDDAQVFLSEQLSDRLVTLALNISVHIIIGNIIIMLILDSSS